MESHGRVDSLFAEFTLGSADGYRAFLTAHARAVGALEPVARPMLPRLALLARDFAEMDAALPAPLPMSLPDGDAQRWGMLYALEGSRLGGAVLNRAVGPGLPNAYLSATHGKGEWAAFQQTLDDEAAKGDESWLAGAVEGALAAFAAFECAARDERVSHG
nr:biliverdin-producing heme oxygenase [Sphingobium sp. OAS761]